MSIKLLQGCRLLPFLFAWRYLRMAPSMNNSYRWEMCWCRWLCRCRLRTWLSKWWMFHMFLSSSNVLPFLTFLRNFRAQSFLLFFSLMKLCKLLPHGLLTFSWVHVHVTGYGSLVDVLILTCIFFVKPCCIFPHKRERKGEEKEQQLGTLNNKKGGGHRYLKEVDCSSGQFKSAKLKDKEYTINAPIFFTTLQK